LQPRLALWLTLLSRTSSFLLSPSFPSRSCLEAEAPAASRRSFLSWGRDMVLLRATTPALRRLKMVLLSLAMGKRYCFIRTHVWDPTFWRSFADKLINIIGISLILFLFRASGVHRYISSPESANEHSIKCIFCRKEISSKASWSNFELSNYISRTSLLRNRQ
jgi:hypothetical protein